MIIEVACAEEEMDTVREALNLLSPSGTKGVCIRLSPEERGPRLVYSSPVPAHGAFFAEKARGVQGVLAIYEK